MQKIKMTWVQFKWKKWTNQPLYTCLWIFNEIRSILIERDKKFVYLRVAVNFLNERNKRVDSQFNLITYKIIIFV